MIKDNDKEINDYQYRRHNKNLLLVHIIFVVKYRKPLLVNDIRKSIMSLLVDVCKKKRLYIKKMETDIDHIHILLQFKPTNSISGIVSALKANTTFHIWEQYPEQLNIHFWKEKTFWSDGYFCSTIGNASKETILKYIENQG